MDDTPKPASLSRSFLQKQALTIKLAGVLLLVLVLLIPLHMIRGILCERMGRRDAAVADIASTWGGEQVIVGPVLVIPYRYRVKNLKERVVDGRHEQYEVEETSVTNAYFLPAQVNIDGALTPSRLHRGIYEATVYAGTMEISGQFAPPDFAALGVAEPDVDWGNGLVTLAVSDLRGTGEMLSIRMNDQTYAFAPGCRLNGFATGINARVPDIRGTGRDLDFKMHLALKGSHGISFAPVGKQNRVKLASAWPTPSFRGAYLPAERQVSGQRFNAAWDVSWYGRNYPQQATDRGGNQAFTEEKIRASLFGVDFITLVDTYRLVERAMKYGALFIVLIFAAFFLFEILTALRVHTVQYTLVGAALCLFYLAVMSLSEFIRFRYAYWIGAAASALLIILYSLNVLKTGRQTTIIAATLCAIYAYLYIALRLQDYSLLVGTAGLFVFLGIVMYATRNVDWFARDRLTAPNQCESPGFERS